MTASLAPALAWASYEREELVATIEQLTKLLHEESEKVTVLQNKYVDNRPKLTPKEVTVIRAMARHGLTHKAIADIYDVNPATISRTVRGQYHGTNR